MTCRCSCCEKTGACCTEEGCSQETCSDCNDLGGVFQGVDTDCTGEGEDECPCDPPADPTLCQKCVDGEAESFCPESKPNCCDGVCQEEPCEECSGECDIFTEVVYFGNQTGSHLQLDGDSFPVCNSAAALPEVISGSFTLGTADGCAGDSCGCEVKFRFWRNLFSTCNSGSNSDITTQTVEVECTAGSVTVRTSGGDVPLNASESHVFSTIDFDSSQGAVSGSGSGECFSVAATSSTPAFTVTATLDWSNDTDHDLYGEVSCGGCA